MDYAQRQKFARQIALAVVCVAGITALICAQAPEGDEEWELDSTTAEMAESVINLMNRLADNISATQLNRRSPKYAFEATERLHERETDLDDARKTALRDLFELDEGAASVYVVLTDEILRKNWIRRNLKDMGFPDLDADAT